MHTVVRFLGGPLHGELRAFPGNPDYWYRVRVSRDWEDYRYAEYYLAEGKTEGPETFLYILRPNNTLTTKAPENGA